METPNLEIVDGLMATSQGYRRPPAGRYSSEEKAAAVRMVRALRAELGTEHGTVQRVSTQLGYGVESVRVGVKQSDVDDGNSVRVTTTEARWANDILKRAMSFFGAELDRRYRK
jgi:transposase-like protein